MSDDMIRKVSVMRRDVTPAAIFGEEPQIELVTPQEAERREAEANRQNAIMVILLTLIVPVGFALKAYLVGF